MKNYIKSKKTSVILSGIVGNIRADQMRVRKEGKDGAVYFKC